MQDAREIRSQRTQCIKNTDIQCSVGQTSNANRGMDRALQGHRINPATEDRGRDKWVGNVWQKSNMWAVLVERQRRRCLGQGEKHEEYSSKYIHCTWDVTTGDDISESWGPAPLSGLRTPGGEGWRKPDVIREVRDESNCAGDSWGQRGRRQSWAGVVREKVQAQTWEDTHDAAATFAVSPECLMLIPIRALGTCPLGLERPPPSCGPTLLRPWPQLQSLFLGGPVPEPPSLEPCVFLS